ncbi:phosphoglycerate mutase family [Pyrenophora seminiperda CCB06]|uniref:Phosphoglycerate mutase family n=1 Tax=Pyrenophora seminiperda CCB06 TaxID=1302712 RepID=A0A3M7M189_9PLEO|nr:phosphoglycerate mutase family [Pyrenophora seminiperda CCB06]
MTPLIHLIRHGKAAHNVQSGYPDHDPPLTKSGHYTTKHIELAAKPDLILISPMTRTLQTAMNMFPFLVEQAPFDIPVQVWPDLREANDAICNKGLSRAELESKYPQFNFSECNEEWDYPEHTISRATERAERVRKRLKELSMSYSNIAVITHRGFKEFLVKGKRFGLAEVRCYRFASEEEARDEKVRRGVNSNTLKEQDFGPTVLILDESQRKDRTTQEG